MQMADISGDALLPLADSERDTALIGGVTDATANNKLFGMTFAELAAAQQRVSPLSVSVERTLVGGVFGREYCKSRATVGIPNNQRKTISLLRKDRSGIPLMTGILGSKCMY